MEHKFKAGDIIKHRSQKEYLIVIGFVKHGGGIEGGYRLAPLAAGIDSYEFNIEWIDRSYILAA